MMIRLGKKGPGISIVWLRTYAFSSKGGKVKRTCKLGRISWKWLEASE